jgi:NAD(P)-dependent dehydrogenase (short-subunit alcohol dehydrogenase family)
MFKEQVMELQDKTIIITGASSGIGAAAAALFAAEGANVVLGARRVAELDRLAAEIANAGGKVAVLAGDAKHETFADGLVDLAIKTFGGVDGAFNNAGIVGEMLPLADMDIANWNEVIAVNLTSAFLAAKAQIPALKRRGGGSIVFTSSFVGYSNGGMPGMTAYAASKAGLIGLVRSLASDYATDGMRINALLPGGTVTPSGGEGNPPVLDFIANLHPMKRMANAKEIAQAALFLLSGRSSFMTGSPMIVDGGMSVRLT